MRAEPGLPAPWHHPQLPACPCRLLSRGSADFEGVDPGLQTALPQLNANGLHATQLPVRSAKLLAVAAPEDSSHGHPRREVGPGCDEHGDRLAGMHQADAVRHEAEAVIHVIRFVWNGRLEGSDGRVFGS